MRIINKIAVLISWPRELDMLSIFINDKKVVIIVDDLKYEEKERFENSSIIKNILINRGLDYVFLSSILGRLKYRILISTAQTFQEKITYKSFSKYIFAHTFGRLFDLLGVSRIFIYLFSRPLNAGGSQAKKFYFHQIERDIGFKVIKFPKGLDISMKIFPNDRFKEVFDTFLCHSNIDYDLIKSKFSNPECIKIGYPRYDDNSSKIEAREIIYNQFKNLDKDKSIVLWVPGHIKFKNETSSNIQLWLPIVSKLTDKYNLIIRPHPKTLRVNPNIQSKLESLGLFVDSMADRKLSTLYIASDVVLADYGGSVLDCMYLKKKYILLNMPITYKFTKWRANGNYIDEKIRNDILSLDYVFDLDIKDQIEKTIMIENNKKRQKLKEKYFGLDNEFVKINDYKLLLEKEILKHKAMVN